MMSFTIFSFCLSFFSSYIYILLSTIVPHTRAATFRTVLSGRGSQQTSQSLVCYAVEKFIQCFPFLLRIPNSAIDPCSGFFSSFRFFCLSLPVVKTGPYIRPVFRIEDGVGEKLVGDTC